MDSKIIKKIIKQLNIYYWPVWLLIMSLLFIFWVLVGYFELTKNIDNTYLSALNGIITITCTFFGIFTPLLINRNWKKSDDKRELSFMLSDIWNELNRNKITIENVKINFTFKRMLEQITDFEELVLMVGSKFRTTQKICNRLSDKYFITALNSKTFTKVDNDDTYNAIYQTYENISNLKQMFSVVYEDFRLKKNLIKFQKEKLPLFLENQYKQIFKENLIKIWREILFNKQLINIALDNINLKLNYLDIKASREPKKLEEIIELPDDAEIIPDKELFK